MKQSSTDATSYIHALITEGEHQQQDFKFEISDARKIAKTLSAFANTRGGRLLIGVKDNGKIAGVRSDEEKYMIETAAQMYCRPQINFHTQTYQAEGRTILIVQIMENTQKPVCAQNEDGQYLAYIRIKDENILATPVHLRVWQQIRKSKGDCIAYTEREQRLLTLLQTDGGLTLNQCTKRTHLPRPTVVNMLAQFVRYELIEISFKEHKFYFNLKP